MTVPKFKIYSLSNLYKSPSSSYRPRLRSIKDIQAALEQERLKQEMEEYQRQQQALAELQYLNYLKQQEEAKAAQEERKNADFFKRTGHTLLDVGGHIAGGISRGIEGVVDYLGGLTGLMSEEQIAHDWTSKNILQPLESHIEHSYIYDLSPTGQTIIRGVAEGVGQMLPAIAATYLTGGGSLAYMTTFGLGAAGGATQEALQEGATKKQALAYGALSGLKEIMIEKLFSAGGQKLANVTGLADNVIAKLPGKTLQTIANIAGEGLEEVAADLVDPFLKQWTYKKGEPRDPYDLEEMGLSFVIGSLTAAVFEGANVVIQKGTNADIGEILTEYDNINKMNQAKAEDGILTEADIEEGERLKGELAAALQRKLNRMSFPKQVEIASKYGEHELFVDYHPEQPDARIAAKPFEPSIEKEIGGVVQDLQTGKITLKEGEEIAIQATFDVSQVDETTQQRIAGISKFAQAVKAKYKNAPDIVFDNSLDENTNGFYDPKNNVIRINPNAENSYQRLFQHELNHYFENTKGGNEYREFVLNALKEEGSYDSEYAKIMETYASLLEGKTETEKVSFIEKEMSSRYSERLFKDEASIKRLVEKKPSLAKRIWEFIKDLIARLKGESKELRTLRQAEKLFAKALESAETEVRTEIDTEVTYALAEKEKAKQPETKEMAFKEKTRETALQVEGTEVKSKQIQTLKKKQLEEVLKTNPMTDDYHVGIRTLEDIKTFGEVLNDEESFEWGDFSREQAKEAFKKGTITVYSSKDIKNGTFVSTSYRQALEYAGQNKNKVNSKEVSIYDVAWINGDEGIMAKVDLDINHSKTINISANEETTTKKPETKEMAFKETATQAIEKYASKELMKQIEDKEFIYTVSPNIETVDKAKKLVKDVGIETQLDEAISELEAMHSATKQAEVAIAKAALLVQKGNAVGLNAKTADLIATMAATLNQLGKTTQAASIIQKLSPEGKFLTLQKLAGKFSQEIKTKKRRYAHSKEFKIIKRERETKWLQKDIQVIKKQNITKLEVDIKLKPEFQESGIPSRFINNIVRLTPESQNYVDNLTSIFKEFVSDENKAGKYAEQYAEAVKNDLQELKNRYDNDPVLIPVHMQEELSKAKSKEAIEEISKKIEQSLNMQKTGDFWDKMTQWRYISMLFNPKTWGRNYIGNVVMKNVVNFKNFVARALEPIIIKDKSKRTRTFKKPSEKLLLFLEEHTGKHFQDIESKFQEMKPGKRVYASKPLEAVRKVTYWALETGDTIFVRDRYMREFAEWATAKGLTATDLQNNPKLMEQGSDYAMKQALEATFKDSCRLIEIINRERARSRLADFAISAVMPFTKTPINIARRGLEYSPLSIIKAMRDYKKVKSGEITASEWVNTMSKGLTGSAILFLGMFLASTGLVKGGADENKKAASYEKALGMQPFSIEIAGKSYTLDWVQPTAIPFFTGVEIYRALSQKDQADYWGMIGAYTTALDPLTEMSFLQGINRALSSYDDNKIAGFAVASMQSFLAQFFPTLGSQIAKAIDDTRRTTGTTGKGYSRKVKQSINYFKSKIPYYAQHLQPYVNVWGEEEVDTNWINRIMENFAYPFWVSEIEKTPVDKEILRLYTAYGNTEVLPSIPNYYYTKNGVRIDMTEEEYTEFKKKVGKFSYEQLQAIFSSNFYQELDDENKEKIIKKTYEYAREFAKGERVFYAYQALGNMSHNLTLYLSTISSIEGEKDDQGDTIYNSKKQKVIAYIEAQKLSKAQKYILYAHAGYKIPVSAWDTVKDYINSLTTLSPEQKREYWEYLIR
jgi:hypothetical protein